MIIKTIYDSLALQAFCEDMKVHGENLTQIEIKGSSFLGSAKVCLFVFLLSVLVVTFLVNVVALVVVPSLLLSQSLLVGGVELSKVKNL